MQRQKEEQWADIKGFEGRYKISTWGRVASIGRLVRCKGNGFRMVYPRILKTRIHKDGYVYCKLRSASGRPTLSVHRLVLQTFVGECPKGFETCHNNGDK